MRYASLCLLLAGIQAGVREWPELPPQGWTTSMRVIRVVDGDTVRVEVRREMSIRLIDCWAPENSTEPGKAATERMRELLPRGSEGTLFVPETEKFEDSVSLSRVTGYVWSEDGGESVNQRMVAEGFAKPSKPKR